MSFVLIQFKLQIYNIALFTFIDLSVKVHQQIKAMTSNDPHRQSMEQMVDRVLNQKQDWSKHLAHTCCRCEKCTCGKHLCKFQPMKINIKPSNTTYHDSYKKNQGHISNPKLNVPYDVYEPSQFVKKSEYKDEYYRKKAQREKIQKGEKKQDNLQLGGPMFAETTYKNSYIPKYAAPPEKIINPQNLGNSRSRMNATSSYRDNYNWSSRKPNHKQQPVKYKDNMKIDNSGIFYGQSSYGHDYHKHKDFKQANDNFAPNQKYQPVHGVRPKSSYRSDYTTKRTEKCPALKCPEYKCC